MVLLKDAPFPMFPSRSESHDMLADKSPSSASSAVPVKLILLPIPSEVPSAGAVMVTVGAVLAVIVTVIWAVVVMDSLSVIDAVMVCVFTVRLLMFTDAPVSKSPS